MTIPFPTAVPLEVFLLGTIPFEDAQRLQKRLVYELGESGTSGALILCEHPPTISIGRSGSRAHVRPDDEALRESGIKIHWVNRGGGCVLHVPGQLAAYLALPLQPFRLSVQDYLDRLHRVVIEVLQEFDLKARCDPESPGVFLGNARVATVGVAFNRWIAYHGLTLNVGPYLSDFHLLQEPGVGSEPLRQTSMESRRQRPAPMAKVRECLVRRIEAVFGVEQHHVYTDHPMIRRKIRPHVYASSLG